MSFDYSTLITNRARSDSDTLKTLLSKPMAEWTAEERTAFNGAVMRGSYDYTDLNRVDACLEDLVARLGHVGCNVPGYKRLKIERAVTPSSRLPEGYTEVQYIQSTGTQWVDTGFKPNQNTRVKMDCNVIRFNSTDMFLFGARIAARNTAFGIAADDDNTQWWTFFGNGQGNPHGTCIGKHTIDFNKNTLSLDGNVFSFDSTSFQSAYNLLLFASITNGNVDSQRGQMAVYSCQIYDNGNLIRDFVPCVDPTGNAGLYDLVSGKFYGNSGTGVFLAGPPRAMLPEGYTQLEYIESSGSQRIDTGFQPDQNSRVLIDAEILSKNSGTDHHIGSVFSNSHYWTLRLRADRTGYAARYDGRALTNISHTGDVFARHWFDQNKNKIQVDGGTVTTFTAATWSATANLPIFCYTGSGTSFSGYISMRLRLHKIYDNGILIRFFIPCKNAGGAVGLYDLVNGKFYGNAETGSFTAGPVVTWEDKPEEPTEALDPYTWYESDVPTVSLLAHYRANVAAVRAALRLPEGTPGVPETMRRLTVTEANSIEAILLALNLILNQISAAVRHCGVTVCGSKGVRA